MKQTRVKAQFIFEIGFSIKPFFLYQIIKNCWKDGVSKSIISVDFSFTAIENFDISNIEKVIFSRMELLKDETDFYVTEVKKEWI